MAKANAKTEPDEYVDPYNRRERQARAIRAELDTLPETMLRYELGSETFEDTHRILDDVTTKVFEPFNIDVVGELRQVGINSEVANVRMLMQLLFDYVKDFPDIFERARALQAQASYTHAPRTSPDRLEQLFSM